MKSIFKISTYALIFFLSMVLLSACSSCNSQKDLTSSSSIAMTQSFDTPQEAVAQAKSDLIEILQSNKEIDLGISADDLKSSVAGAAMEQLEINFQDLMQADSTTIISDLGESDINSVVPYNSNGRTVTVAEIAEDDGQWQISGLANKDLSDDLDIIQRVVGSNAKITIHQVPNLNTTIYEVNDNGNISLHTSYGGRSLREANSSSSLLPILSADARDFWDQYGDQIQQGELVK